MAAIPCITSTGENASNEAGAPFSDTLSLSIPQHLCDTTSRIQLAVYLEERAEAGDTISSSEGRDKRGTTPPSGTLCQDVIVASGEGGFCEVN